MRILVSLAVVVALFGAFLGFMSPRLVLAHGGSYQGGAPSAYVMDKDHQSRFFGGQQESAR